MRLLAFLLLPGSLRLDFDSPAASVTGMKVTVHFPLVGVEVKLADRAERSDDIGMILISTIHQLADEFVRDGQIDLRHMPATVAAIAP
jgi:hypothetical protein